MELIYMYIKSYKNKLTSKDQDNYFIEDVGFNFSDNFHCEFKLEKGLIISKKDITYPDFYGEYIKGIKVIVGSNGSGKTTILDILGMQRESRCDDHFIRKYWRKNNKKFGITPEEDLSYFASEYIIVYHLEKNIFVIEFTANFHRDNEYWIKNLNKESVKGINNQKNMFYKIPIGFAVEYNFDNNDIIATKIHCYNGLNQMVTKEGYIAETDRISEIINLYYFSHEFSHRHSDTVIRKAKKSEDDSGYFVRRQKLKLDYYEPNDYMSIYKILNLDKFELFIDNMLNFEPLIIFEGDFQGDEYLFDFITRIEEQKKSLFKEKFDSIRNKLKQNSNNLKIKNTKFTYLYNLVLNYIMDTLNSLVRLIYDKHDLEAFVEIGIWDIIEITDNFRKNLCNKHSFNKCTKKYSANNILLSYTMESGLTANNFLPNWQLNFTLKS